MSTMIVPNDLLFDQVEVFLNEGKEVIVSTKGNSMLPYIRGGEDSVVLKKSDELEIGDIVLVRLPDRFILHRIISANGDDFVMMGDGNIAGTESFRRENVLGKVIWIVKKNGRKIKPGKGKFWRRMLPFRRYILAIYRRII